MAADPSTAYMEECIVGVIPFVRGALCARITTAAALLVLTKSVYVQRLNGNAVRASASHRTTSAMTSRTARMDRMNTLVVKNVTRRDRLDSAAKTNTNAIPANAYRLQAHAIVDMTALMDPTK
jgi:hypothetical protein